MIFLKYDPGPCPVDDAPHTTCCAPGTGGVIVAGPIQTPTSITVPAPTSATRVGDTKVEPPTPPPPPPSTTFTTKDYRGRNKREPPPSTTGG